jgi:threonine dehydrogenase-like Zn-dependent dehydrogenase
VYAPGKIPYESCRLYRTGFELHCPEKAYVGYEIPGALAEYTAVPEAALCPVPDGVTDAEVAAMQPLASAVVAVGEAGIEPGNVVAVVGTGVMGSHCGQLAFECGAREVVGIDVKPAALDIAEANGLRPVDATAADPVEAVRDATGGVGADVVFEAVGGDQDHGTSGSDPLARSIRMARSGGTVVQIGYVIGQVSLSPRGCGPRT